MGSDSHDPAVRFDKVLESELAEIEYSRGKRLQNLNPRVEADLTGLALSGGDVRSATFGLGVFQGLARHGLLRRFDYLSSTGGGAEIAGWLLTWIHSQGLDEVEKQLAGGSGVGEAREIQGLRQSTISSSRRNFGPSSVLTWLRNAAANLFTFAALFAGFVLFARGLLTVIDQLFRFEVILTRTFAPAVLGALLFGVFARRAERPYGMRSRSWLFWSAVILIILASFLASMGLARQTIQHDYINVYLWWEGAGFLFGYVFWMCLFAWLPRQRSLKMVLAQVAAAITAGGVAAILIIGLHQQISRPLVEWLYYRSTTFAGPIDSYYFDRSLIFADSPYVIATHITGPLILFVLVIALSLYGFIVRRWMSREARSLSLRLCRVLLCFAIMWFLLTLFWHSVFSAALQNVLAIPMVLLVLGGLVKAANIRPSAKWKIVSETAERVAPYVFIFGLTAVVAQALSYASYQLYLSGRAEMAIGIIVMLLSLLLMWAMRASGFSVHEFHQTRILRNSVAPAVRPEAGKNGGEDCPLSSLGGSNDYAAPYPLFGASLDVVDVPASFSIQPRTIPFLFSPRFSGFDSSRPTESGSETLAAYRPTDKLAGGISLTEAIAMARPLRDQSLRPSSAPSAMLWTLFSVREGRFIGNPVRNDKWKKSGPLIEPLYALREGYGEFASEAAYVRPAPGQEFDNLSIYELVKRKCKFIVACDATHDPEFAFNDLGAAIRRCRTELGVEIDMGLGPFGRTPASAGAHYQIAQIRYSAEETGMMIYIKPSLTGDEPTDLSQYCKSHAEFPASRVAEGNFDESAFESYRRLGEHIVDSLLAEIPIDAQTETTQIFNVIRQRLQPDFKPEETAPATDSAVSVPPHELVEAIASGECVLCAGPGLAAQAKLPTWPTFVEGLLRAARDGGTIDAASAAALTAALAAGELDAVADDLIHEMSQQQLVDYVESATSAAEPSVAHRTLAGMKFLGALNTNLDSLVGDAFQSRAGVASEADKLVEALQNNKFFVANPFGIRTNPSSLLFTMKQFRQSLSANSKFKQFLGTLFLRYTVVFIGSGIDGVRNFLEALELPNTPERPHYAIIPNASQIDPVKVRFLERSYNTRVIDYKPQFDFAGLPAFLKELEKRVNQSELRPRASGNLILKSVSLENIGPFRSLHLELTPTWNLLLGDNGVGKTVLLKAIAVALCGENANPDVVKKLLRSGASQGSIRLRDNNREYTVELKRQMDGSIKVTSASLSPIIYERWLVLGFPALRSISSDSPKGPTKVTRHAPSVEDLLPLLSYEPDRRMSDIKQWLVNLDYAAKSEYSALAAKKTREDFTRVLQRLTPGLRLELGPVDAKTMQISVVTDAGLVPLELVSQGTVSVMCWIGTLLERLAETGTSRSDSKNSVLVLIDELDAHMHPKWQQMFVDAFRKEFASVQIIATTHSPLLVGSLEAEEILHVRRVPLCSEIYGVLEVKDLGDGTRELVVLGPEEDDETQAPTTREVRRYVVSAKEKLLVSDGEIVEEGEPLTQDPTHVEIKPFTAKEDGWRADQILTSPLFELDSTRNPKAARLLNEYKELSVEQFQTTEQKNQLLKVAAELEIRLPTPHEKEEARQAYELIEEFAKKRLEKIPEAWRRKVLDEVKLQLTESVTGSRRPE